MILWFTVLVMLIVAYSSWQEGIYTAFCMTVNVFLAGLLAFNFWEPMAEGLEPLVQSSFLEGYEDALSLALLFGVFLGLLRFVTNKIVSSQIQFQALVQQFGAIAFGLLTGYLLAGFQCCLFQTLPTQEDFLGFQFKMATAKEPETAIRSYLPPDRVWLGLMHRAGLITFQRGPELPTFDPQGSFEQRYARYRRFTETRRPMISAGELGP